jgi:hypothetical protein
MGHSSWWRRALSDFKYGDVLKFNKPFTTEISKLRFMFVRDTNDWECYIADLNEDSPWRSIPEGVLRWKTGALTLDERA